MRTAAPILILSLVSFVYTGCGGGSSSGGGGGGVVTHFFIDTPSNIPSATTLNVTVTALDASNSRVVSYSGTVHFSSSDPKAQLPPDTQLHSGSGVFPVRLPTAGNQTIAVTDAGVASLSGNSTTIAVSALPDAFPVETFGAKGDGHTDDTVAIQSAINAAVAAGGGSVVFKVARYFTTGTFNVSAGVILCGSLEGPFDVAGINPALTTVAPTLLVTNTVKPFITLSGSGSGVADLLFHYPNQVSSSEAAPTVYPYTIVQEAPGAKVVRTTVTNAYNFLDIELGRVMARDLYIGAFNNGIYIDHTFDFVSLQDIHEDVFWDDVDNLPYPRPIDAWVLNHGTALEAKQMDSVEIHNFSVFSRKVGMLLTYSSDTGGYALGTGSDITLEAVQYGIVSDATNSPGFQFSNLQVSAAPGLGQAAVQLKSGGTNPPRIIITGGATEGNWALGAFPTPEAGSLILENVM